MSDEENTSRSRRSQSIKIDDIKDEIERERAKMAAKAAEPEADVKPEDMVLFKDRAARKAQAEADALAAKQVEIERALAEKKARKAANLAKKRGLDPKESEPVIKNNGSKKPAKKTSTPKIKELDAATDESPEILEKELPDDVTSLSTVEQPGMSWNKFFKMSAAKKATIVLGIGLPTLVIIGAVLWFTRSWRDWPGNLVVVAIPTLIILTYVMDHFAQDKYWQEYRGSKILSRANRQDAAIVIPLILFMGVLSLNADMFLMDGIFHFFRFVLIGAVVWAGLIWMTRKVPPIRKFVREEKPDN